MYFLNQSRFEDFLKCPFIEASSKQISINNSASLQKKYRQKEKQQILKKRGKNTSISERLGTRFLFAA